MYRVEVPIQQAVDLTLFCFSSWETCTFGRLGAPCPNMSRVRWWVAIPPRVNPISLQKCCTNWLSGCSRVCRSKTSMSHFYSPKSFFFLLYLLPTSVLHVLRLNVYIKIPGLCRTTDWSKGFLKKDSLISPVYVYTHLVFPTGFLCVDLASWKSLCRPGRLWTLNAEIRGPCHHCLAPKCLYKDILSLTEKYCNIDNTFSSISGCLSWVPGWLLRVYVGLRMICLPELASLI